jgi:hypothetical protein
VRIRTLGLAVGTALMIFLATPASAQMRSSASFLPSTTAPAAAAMANGPATVAVGVSFLHLGDFDVTAKGFSANVGVPVKTSGNMAISVAGDFGYHKDQGDHATSFLGGVRVSSTANAQFTPGGEFLIGATSFGPDGETATTFAFGGFVDIKLNDKISFRGQIDFMHFSFNDGSTNGQRFMFGISVPMGGK